MSHVDARFFQLVDDVRAGVKSALEIVEAVKDIAEALAPAPPDWRSSTIFTFDGTFTTGLQKLGASSKRWAFFSTQPCRIWFGNSGEGIVASPAIPPAGESRGAGKGGSGAFPAYAVFPVKLLPHQNAFVANGENPVAGTDIIMWWPTGRFGKK